jgi:tripartite-type tricarboxylate transporter receptor subunit TctC
MHRFRNARLLGVGFALSVLFATPAAADTVKIIVPFAAGGPVDMVARLLAQELGPRLNADVVVENRGGAGGALAAEMVVRAPPDGKTLYVASHGSFVINAVLRPPAGYDPRKAFTAIGLMGAAPSLFIVRKDHPAAALTDLIAMAKKDGKMSYASAGAGTTMHIAGEQLNAAAGIKLVHVPYRGAAPALNDLLGGHVDIMNADLPVLLPHVTSGKARALVLASPERTPLLPNLATTAELGYPDVVMENWYGFFAPAGLSPDMQAKLEKAMLETVKVPTVAERFRAGGVRGALDGKAFAEHLDREFSYWGPQIKKLGITAD